MYINYLVCFIFQASFYIVETTYNTSMCTSYICKVTHHGYKYPRPCICSTRVERYTLRLKPLYPAMGSYQGSSSLPVTNGIHLTDIADIPQKMAISSTCIDISQSYCYHMIWSVAPFVRYMLRERWAFRHAGARTECKGIFLEQYNKDTPTPSRSVFKLNPFLTSHCTSIDNQAPIPLHNPKAVTDEV